MSRTLEGFEISAAPFVVAYESEDEITAAVQVVRQQIGFYGSTPAYRPVLELHGWGHLHDELNALTKRGEWDQLADAIDDEVLHTFAIIGTPKEAVEQLRRRYGDVASRMTLAAPPNCDAEHWTAVVASLRWDH